MLKKTMATVLAAGGLTLAGAGLASASTPAHHSLVRHEAPRFVQVQIPVSIPITLCGNSITVIGLQNPVFGDSCRAS